MGFPSGVGKRPRPEVVTRQSLRLVREESLSTSLKIDPGPK